MEKEAEVSYDMELRPETIPIDFIAWLCTNVK